MPNPPPCKGGMRPTFSKTRGPLLPKQFFDSLVRSQNDQHNALIILIPICWGSAQIPPPPPPPDPPTDSWVVRSGTHPPPPPPGGGYSRGGTAISLFPKKRQG